MFLLFLNCWLEWATLVTWEGRGGFWTNTFSLKAALYEGWGVADSDDWYTFICKVALASYAGPLSCRIAIKQPPRVPIEDDRDGHTKFSHKGHIASLYRSPASQQKLFLLSYCAFLTYRGICYMVPVARVPARVNFLGMIHILKLRQ